MATPKTPFQATSSWCYSFARYEAMPEILVMSEVAIGDVVLLRDCTQKVLDKYLTPEQQNLTYQRAKSEGEVKIKSAVKFFVAYMADETGAMFNLGKGSFRKVTTTPQAEVDAVEAAAIDDAAPESVAEDDDLKGWIYAFTFAMIAKSAGDFPIKIGKASGDVTARVTDQCRKTATFEQPTVLGSWRVSRMSQTEAAVHAVLKARGKWRDTAPGIEWFNTTICEVAAIVDFVAQPCGADPRGKLS